MRLVVIAIVVSVYSVISYGVPSYRINSPPEVMVIERYADDSMATDVPTTEDVDTTRRIRQALIKDTTLSTYAQNVKVFTLNNRVTLKGPVRTKDESDQVQEKAFQVAGREAVVNEMDIISNESDLK